jgi:hypothetical protein
MRILTCNCDHTFEADLNDLVNLDEEPQQLTALSSGNFMSTLCPACGTVLKPEFPLRLVWPSHNVEYFVIPEWDSVEHENSESYPEDVELLVGYPELADRIAVIDANLNPVAVEALKYYLLLKASEAAPDASATVWFHSRTDVYLEFHLHGLREGEAAITRIPSSVYERTLSDYSANPDAEPFISLRKGTYLSVRNLMEPA